LLVFLDQLAARSLDRLCDHRTAGVDVLPSVGLNSLYELTDNSALGVATSAAGPKTTKTALTVFFPKNLDLGVQARCKFSVLAA
jgi:hypothetical protein